MLTFGYNTSGFAHHRLIDALTILRELGYDAVALTLDFAALNPFDAHLAEQVAEVRPWLQAFPHAGVIETGARFLLDIRRKHQPTLLSDDAADRQQRLDFLQRSIDLAADLDYRIVSFWSGRAATGTTESVCWQRLIDGCRRLADYAAERGVRLAFEPEPGMFVDTMDRFAELHARVGHPAFGLTIDIGHLVCLRETPIAPHLNRWRDWLWNVHIEDMRADVHDHLMFGEGEVDFAEVLPTLAEIGYAEGVYVELSRHSHDAVETARRSLAFLRGAWRAEGVNPPSLLK
jgi:sugar phosphate isomerase/epimerase